MEQCGRLEQIHGQRYGSYRESNFSDSFQDDFTPLCSWIIDVWLVYVRERVDVDVDVSVGRTKASQERNRQVCGGQEVLNAMVAWKHSAYE